jgi:phosphatidylglycerophosphate synthase
MLTSLSQHRGQVGTGVPVRSAPWADPFADDRAHRQGMSSLTLAPPRPVVRVGPVRTVANGVTLVRTVLAVALGLVGVASGDLAVLAVAYAVYWVGDILDGWAARRLGQETRLGAVLDIVSDRACTSVLCAGLVAHVGGVVPVAVVFLLSFMVLDTMLSLAFLCWPLVSPNEFHLVDRQVWRLNWSPPAKALNSAAVVLAVVLGLPGPALAIAAAVLGVKVLSAGRVLALLERDAR